MIRVQSLCKAFRDGEQTHTILDNLQIDLPSGQSLAITGASGCGKSTLLHILASLEKADSGDIQVDQLNIRSLSEKQADDYRRRHLGIVFQQFNLIDCLSVADNLHFTPRLNCNLDQQHIERLVIAVSIQDLLSRYPTDLSGGEQQRVAIARALAHKPRLLLADEPTGNLDESHSEQVAALLFDACKQTNTTLVVVTHSLDLAAQADVQAKLHNGKLALAL